MRARQLPPRKRPELNNPAPKTCVQPKRSSTVHRESSRNGRMRRRAVMHCKQKTKRSLPLPALKVQTPIHPESRPINRSVTCRQFKVTGRVQGVFFRVSTRDVAVPLQITGHAVNLPDGSVEVLACGEPAALAEFERWLHDGPPMASVTRVEAIDVDCEQPQRFAVS